jgi:hypothetical protein
MFTDPTPVWGDSDNVLLQKICQVTNDLLSGIHPPQPGDSDNNLLFKIANLFNRN